MKKIFLVFISLLVIATQCFAYAEKNTISQVYNNGKIIKMLDGSVYEIYGCDVVTSNVWLPMTDVVITDDHIINIEDNESVEYIRRLR